MHDFGSRRAFLLLSTAALASAAATPLLAQSARGSGHAGVGAGRGGGATADHAEGHPSGGHTDDSQADHDHTGEDHEPGGSHAEHAETGKGKGPKYQGGGERGGSGGHEDDKEHDHTDAGDSGRRGPYYRGGRDVSGVTHGRGRSLEDRVLRANGDVHGG